jgi:hypothetical protein
MAVHIVTAFFEIPSKQPAEFYITNAIPILSKCAAHITLFTSAKFAEQFHKMRGDLPFTLVVLEVGEDNLPQDLPIKSVLSADEWKIASQKFTKRHSAWNKTGFSVQLLQLYLSKAWFVEKVIGMNKASEYEVYMWADIGSCRSPEHQENVAHWPSIHTLRQRGFNDNKLIFYQRKEAPREARSDMDLSSVIAGSHIYGTACAWEKVTADISRMVRQHIQKFSGDGVCDETVYFALTQEKPEKYKRIRVYWGDKEGLGWYETYNQDFEGAEPLVKAYVINLPHRVDRWQKMQQNWIGIVDTLVRVDGIKSSKRFQGCALAHISAIRTAWNDQEQEGKIVFVLEDDAVPHEGLTRSKLLEILAEARNASAQFDALFLSPLISPVAYDSSSIQDLSKVFTKTSTSFFRASPSQLLICCAMMVYSKRVLNWLDEYEAHVNDINAQQTIPNDRILSSDSWKALNEQRIYNRPEVWVTSHQVAYVGDSKSDNGGVDMISNSIEFKRTPALLKDLAERAQPISNEFRTPKPLRITLLENWHGGKLSIDASFTLHSAFLTNAAGIRERIDDRLKMLLGDSSHRYGYGYKYFADGVLEFNAWIGEHAYQIEVPQGYALYWEHALREDTDGAIAVPAVPTEAATDFTYRYRDDSAFGIVAANVSSSDLHFLGDFSYARRFRVFQCNTRAYLLHIIENYEDLDEVTAFVIGDASDYPVSARSPQDEILALIHEAFAHGYAELSTLGPFRPDDVPEVSISPPKKVDIAIQLSQMSKDAFCKVLGLKAQWYTMPPIFAVRKDHILRRPKQFYQRAFDSIPSNTEFSEEQEWMDSLWRSVFVEQPDAEFSKHVHVATVLAADIGGESIQERKDATSEAKVRFAHARANADPKARSAIDLSHLGAANETIQIKWSFLGRCHYSNAALSETNALFS